MGNPVEMHGRWMNWAMFQQGGAQNMVKQWKTFVGAQVPVSMAWGEILSYEIFIHKLKLKFESSGEVAWEITAHMLSDDSADPPSVVAQPPAQPFDVASDMNQLIQQIIPFTPTTYGSLLGTLDGIEDALSLLEGEIQAPFSAIYNVCQSLSSFESALTSDLYGLSNSCNIISGSLSELLFTTDEMMAQVRALNFAPGNVNAGVLSLFSGEQMTRLVTDKVSSDAAVQNLAFLIASLQRTIASITRQQTKTAYAAKSGDTWEQVGINLLGSVDGARAIKSMNQVRYGEQPQPGRKYNVPASS